MNRFVPARFKVGYGQVGAWFLLFKAQVMICAGMATWYQTNARRLEMCEKKLLTIREDSLKMRANDLHEPLRAWENYHRITAAECHMKHIQFRGETRYPGYYYRSDFNFIDDENWKCFVNSNYSRDTMQWAVKKEPYKQLIKD